MAARVGGVVTKKVVITGRYSWQLLFNHDMKEGGAYSGRIEKKMKTVVSRSEFESALESELRAKLSHGVAFKFLSLGTPKYTHHVQQLGMLSAQRSDSNTEITSQVCISHQFDVKAGEKLSMYVLTFEMPGVHFVYDVLSTHPEDCEVQIEVDVLEEAPEGPLYVRDFAIVYGAQQSNMPAGALSEVHDLSNDINNGNGGQYVWLVPEWTTLKTAAATSFVVVQQKTQDPVRADLAKGAGGAFRYVLVKSETGAAPITKVGLFRAAQKTSLLSSPPSRLLHPQHDREANWSGWTANINEGREGGALFIVWQN